MVRAGCCGAAKCCSTCNGADHPRCHLLCQVSPTSGLPPVTKCYKVCVYLSASDMLPDSQWVAPDGPAIATGGKVTLTWRSAKLTRAAVFLSCLYSCVATCQLLVQRWRVLCAKPPGYNPGGM